MKYKWKKYRGIEQDFSNEKPTESTRKESILGSDNQEGRVELNKAFGNEIWYWSIVRKGLNDMQKKINNRRKIHRKFNQQWNDMRVGSKHPHVILKIADREVQ